MGFPGGSDGKASACSTGDLGLDPWVGKIPWRRKWQPTPVLLSGKFHGLRSLVGYSQWDHKKSDTTEQLQFNFVFVLCLYLCSTRFNASLKLVLFCILLNSQRPV